jgi:hypothetical protein
MSLKTQTTENSSKVNNIKSLSSIADINKNRHRKVTIISNFHEDLEISRSNMGYKYFVSRGFDVVVLYSNFSHSLKKFRYFASPKFIPLKTISYSSSFSLRRLLSYFIFAYKVFIYLRKNNTDIVYVNLPPNALAVAVFLACPKEVKIVVDILDLWPESFPHNGNRVIKIALKVAGVIPKAIRRFAIKSSDFCIAESSHFYDTLHLSNKINSKMIHLKKFESKVLNKNEASEVFSIGYLGNIGIIYDFDSLFKIIKGVERTRPICLHIIGLGPRRAWLLNRLKTLEISYVDHGASFDEDFKSTIMSACWFGYNGFKQETEIGLSYKSVDYLSYGLPLLNSLKADTFKLVSGENVGFNFDITNIDQLIQKLSLITSSEIAEMKLKSYSLFKSRFSGESYFTGMDQVLDAIY